VTSAFPAASEAGIEALRGGGNAVDAAVAAAWALAVCEPSGSGLGGQTVALLRLDSGRTLVVDGHSRAPAAVSRRLVSRAEQRAGHRATTVPTTPAVLAHLQRRYGVLPLNRTIEPALRLAEEGYPITRLQSRQLGWCRGALAANEAASAFLAENDRPYEPGELFRQPRLAAALRRIALHGPDDFYRGAIARSIAGDMERHGGLISASDLAHAGPPAEREPISIPYAGYEVASIPPPGGGVELLFALRMLERLDRVPDDPAGWYRSLAEVVYAAFTERERDPAHPQSWTLAQRDLLLGDERTGRLAGEIARTAPVAVGVDREEAGETTHLCAADARGNVISLTQSIQSLFGAKVANPAYGFLYNNYLTTCPRRDHPYRLRGGCPVRSNAAPTLVLDRGRPVLALGAAGSRRIVSSVLHVLSGVLDRGMTLRQALGAPRIHTRLSGRVWLERPAAGEHLLAALAERFREVEVKPRRSYSMGAVQAVGLGRHGTMVGAADPRRDGEARAW
jgi:gamma-glutamyltranspeptidase / glutathione hydrolase